MKIYIAGKVTGENESDVQNKFFSAKIPLIKQGHKVMSPAVLTTNAGFEHGEYIHICYAMIDVCDAIYMLSDWQKSKGARMELQYACDHQKEIMYQDEATKETNYPIVYGHPGNITDISRESSAEELREAFRGICSK